MSIFSHSFNRRKTDIIKSLWLIEEKTTLSEFITLQGTIITDKYGSFWQPKFDDSEWRRAKNHRHNFQCNRTCEQPVQHLK